MKGRPPPLAIVDDDDDISLDSDGDHSPLFSDDLADLAALRKSVQNNLRLRPIRSSSALKSKVQAELEDASPSVYFTPREDISFARYQRLPRPISPQSLYTRLLAAKRPLLIDTRPHAAHHAFHIKFSINIAIPSLILKRGRKPGGQAFSSLDALRQFVTTDPGKHAWDSLMSPGGPWDGDVVIYDEDMNEKDKNSMTIASWALLPILQSLLDDGNADYLLGGISIAGHHPDLQKLVVSGEDEPAVPQKAGGLFQLDTQQLFRPKVEIDQSLSATSTSRPPLSPLPLMPAAMNNHSPRSPSTIVDATPSPPPSQVSFRRPPPPVSKRPSAPNLRRLDTRSAESLDPVPGPSKFSKIGLTVNTSLPRPSARLKPVKSATLAVPPLSINTWNGSNTLHPPSPSHLNLTHSNHSPPGSARWLPTSPINHRPTSPYASTSTSTSSSGSDLSHSASFERGPNNRDSIGTAYYTPPHTPATPKSSHPDSLHPRDHLYADLPPSPSTARPEDGGSAFPRSPSVGSFPRSPSNPGGWPHNPNEADPRDFSSFYPPPSTLSSAGEEDPYPTFTISTILPGFLFLGPEPTSWEHVADLKKLGVKRIVNLAAECGPDDWGLGLAKKDSNENVGFEKYVKIAMRDTVEEEGVAKGVKQVCEILDDARLHSSPTYVHCKAGKSRSVTAVMAYLIHANHWTLSRAYAFVLERRKGISPNIGFVSELMNFEEQELGGKSVGVHINRGQGGGAQPSAPSHMDGEGKEGGYAMAAGNRRGGHVRESLPPTFVHTHSIGSPSLSGTHAESGTISAGPDGSTEEWEREREKMRVMGDLGQEMEIKDASGRYRHARRAPVDETTLQPMRRVSKAGLESGEWGDG
ncbi:hypothetical protein VKT23_016373 [Stygiomarasmius scandens]|uniref:protein-tyrosine-phosphatase n=1 Tax=Marasmiellus scandens TaxID=2682957 RepID=A0ABR1IZ56_9AGAR